jgi:hypothetical protein
MLRTMEGTSPERLTESQAEDLGLEIGGKRERIPLQGSMNIEFSVSGAQFSVVIPLPLDAEKPSHSEEPTTAV